MKKIDNLERQDISQEDKDWAKEFVHESLFKRGLRNIYSDNKGKKIRYSFVMNYLERYLSAKYEIQANSKNPFVESLKFYISTIIIENIVKNNDQFVFWAELFGIFGYAFAIYVYIRIKKVRKNVSELINSKYELDLCEKLLADEDFEIIAKESFFTELEEFGINNDQDKELLFSSTMFNMKLKENSIKYSDWKKLQRKFLINRQNSAKL